MQGLAEAYERTARLMDEIVQSILDLEGGQLVAAVLLELEQRMLDADNKDGAILVAREMADMANVVLPEALLADPNEADMLIRMLIDIIQDAFIEH